MIEDALIKNFRQVFKDNPTRLMASDYEPAICALDEEYGVFKSSKNTMIYKASIVKKCNEIKKNTAENEIHISLVPKDTATFTSASELLKEKEESGEEINPVFQTASSLLTPQRVSHIDKKNTEKSPAKYNASHIRAKNSAPPLPSLAGFEKESDSNNEDDDDSSNVINTDESSREKQFEYKDDSNSPKIPLKEKMSKKVDFSELFGEDSDSNDSKYLSKTKLSESAKDESNVLSICSDSRDSYDSQGAFTSNDTSLLSHDTKSSIIHIDSKKQAENEQKDNEESLAAKISHFSSLFKWSALAEDIKSSVNEAEPMVEEVEEESKVINPRSSIVPIDTDDDNDGSNSPKLSMFEINLAADAEEYGSKKYNSSLSFDRHLEKSHNNIIKKDIRKVKCFFEKEESFNKDFDAVKHDTSRTGSSKKKAQVRFDLEQGHHQDSKEK